MANRVASQVAFEIRQIEQLFETYTELFENTQKAPLNRVEMTAIASVLHSFYNGLENIFLSVARGLDEEVPTHPQWHRDLLFQMSRETTRRGPVISEALAEKLTEYLAFRHFFRHSYSFFLEWAKMEKLAVPLRGVWLEARKQIQEFLLWLSSNPRGERPSS